MAADDPYQPPPSALTAQADPAPGQKVKRIEEAMIEHMRSSRPWLIAAIVFGCGGALILLLRMLWVALPELIHGNGHISAVVISHVVAALHLAVPAWPIVRYIKAIGVVVKSYESRDLAHAYRQRIPARVATFFLIAMVFIVPIFVIPFS